MEAEDININAVDIGLKRVSKMEGFQAMSYGFTQDPMGGCVVVSSVQYGKIWGIRTRHLKVMRLTGASEAWTGFVSVERERFKMRESKRLGKIG